MALSIGNKTFMNLQEAVGWLLENNALPFQSTANYVGNTEIAMSTLINPSPAKVRVGSLIFFADSKVSTVVGVTSNSFICSDQYNDLVDDIVYVSNVALNASGHLIVTLSNGDTIDAGLIKQVSSFSINGSQHLIANYNDSTSTDLGAIFSGNVNIAGDFTADSIIENMSGYSAVMLATTGYTIDPVYVSAVKNGNKLTLVMAVEITKTDAGANNSVALGRIVVPNAIANKLYPTQVGLSEYLSLMVLKAFSSQPVYVDVPAYIWKNGTNIWFSGAMDNLVLNTKYYLRYEATYLLNNSLA